MHRLNTTVNLIVCQKSKVNDWVEHFREHYSEFVYDLTDKNQMPTFLKHCDEGTENAYGVINYDLIFRRPILKGLKDFTLMLDESSLIQNEKSKRAKFILSLNPSNVILLSVTPTSGKYENLWSQVHLLGWTIGRDTFDKQYVNWRKIEVGGFIHKIVDKEDPYKNVDRLKDKMREHGAVFMKTEECFDLPEQNFITVNCGSSKEYRKFKRDSIISITIEKPFCEYTVEDKIKNSDFYGYDVTPIQTLVGDTTLTKMMYQRMLCGQYSMDKLETFQDLVDSTKNRIVVFYNFNEELNQLKRIAKNLDRPISEVNGHIKDLTAYENESDSITFVQYQAGSMGLNLQKANIIIYFTLPLMSEHFEQSKKRIHRIGQKDTCFYYLLICKNTIEEDILQVLETRKDYTDYLFEQGEKEK